MKNVDDVRRKMEEIRKPNMFLRRSNLPEEFIISGWMQALKWVMEDEEDA